MTDGLNIGYKIKTIRLAAKTTQKQLAARLGVSAGYINRMEKGKMIPGLDFIRELSVVFRCDINWLLWEREVDRCV